MERKGKLTLYVICALAFAYMLGSTLYHKHLDTLPQDYTVGKVRRIGKPANGDIKVFFYYIVDKEYSRMGNIGSYRGQIREGEYYLVKFPEGHPGRGIILLDKPVPDSVAAPVQGWDKMPDFAR